MREIIPESYRISVPYISWRCSAIHRVFIYIQVRFSVVVYFGPFLLKEGIFWIIMCSFCFQNDVFLPVKVSLSRIIRSVGAEWNLFLQKHILPCIKQLALNGTRVRARVYFSCRRRVTKPDLKFNSILCSENKRICGGWRIQFDWLLFELVSCCFPLDLQCKRQLSKQPSELTTRK